MNNTELDSIPVSELSDRFGVTRSNIYNRLSKLGIEPEKQGGKAFINADQLALMDSLDIHIKAGGAIADFRSGLSTSHRPVGQAEKSYRTQDSPKLEAAPMTLGVASLIDAIAEKVATIVTVQQPQVPQIPSNPLATLQSIEEAYEKGWHLSTSQLAPLLGLKTLTGKEIKRFGFTFSRVGRNGSESAWTISKE